MNRSHMSSCLRQVTPKRLQASDALGIHITYQHEEQIDYDEISLLLAKVSLILDQIQKQLVREAPGINIRARCR